MGITHSASEFSFPLLSGSLSPSASCSTRDCSAKQDPEVYLQQDCICRLHLFQLLHDAALQCYKPFLGLILRACDNFAAESPGATRVRGQSNCLGT